VSLRSNYGRDAMDTTKARLSTSRALLKRAVQHRGQRIFKASPWLLSSRFIVGDITASHGQLTI
jgi:hypothetical protein